MYEQRTIAGGQTAGTDDREDRALLSLLESEKGSSLSLLTEQLRGFPSTRLTHLAGMAPVQSQAVGLIDLVLAEQLSPRIEAELVRWKSEGGSLEEGLSIVGRIGYPRLPAGEINTRLNAAAEEIRARLPRRGDEARLHALIHCVHNVLGYHANANDYYDPDNSYLNRVLERRMGIPLSLTVVFILLGKRLGIPIHAVLLPGRVIAGMEGHGGTIYFDPFEDSPVLDGISLATLLSRTHAGPAATALRPGTPLQIVYRTLANLEAAYDNREDEERSALAAHLRHAF